jgi:hypothetical protein
MSRKESIKHDVNSCKELSVLLNEFGNEVSSNECLVEVVFTKPSYDMLGVAVNGAHDVDLTGQLIKIRLINAQLVNPQGSSLLREA